MSKHPGRRWHSLTANVPKILKAIKTHITTVISVCAQMRCSSSVRGKGMGGGEENRRGITDNTRTRAVDELEGVGAIASTNEKTGSKLGGNGGNSQREGPRRVRQLRMNIDGGGERKRSSPSLLTRGCR